MPQRTWHVRIGQIGVVGMLIGWLAIVAQSQELQQADTSPNKAAVAKTAEAEIGYSVFIINADGAGLEPVAPMPDFYRAGVTQLVV